MSNYCRNCDSIVEKTEGYCTECGSDLSIVGTYSDDEAGADEDIYDETDEYGEGYDNADAYDEQGMYRDPDSEETTQGGGFGTYAGFDSNYDEYNDEYDDYTDEGIGDDDYYADTLPGSAYQEKKSRFSFGKKNAKGDAGKKRTVGRGNDRSRTGAYADSRRGTAAAPDLSLKQALGIEAVALIPLVGIVFYILWAIGGKAHENLSRANIARAKLIMMGIALVLSLLLGLVVGAAGLALFGQMSSDIGAGEDIEITTTGDGEPEESGSNNDDYADNYTDQPADDPSGDYTDDYADDYTDDYTEDYTEDYPEEQPGTESVEDMPTAENTDMPGSEEVGLQPSEVQSPSTPVTTGYEGLMNVLRTETHAKEWWPIDSSMSVAMGECVVTTSTVGEKVLALTIYAKNQGSAEVSYGTSVFDYAVQNGVMLERNVNTFNDAETYTAYNALAAGAETVIYLAYTLQDVMTEVSLTLEPWASEGAQPALYAINPAGAEMIQR